MIYDCKEKIDISSLLPYLSDMPNILKQDLYSNTMMRFTIQYQHDEVVFESIKLFTKYLFELPTCFDSITSLLQGLRPPVKNHFLCSE